MINGPKRTTQDSNFFQVFHIVTHCCILDSQRQRHETTRLLKNLVGVSRSPALLHVPGVAVGAELHAGGVHDDVTERHADHVVVVDGANADALQVGQRHEQVLAAHRAAVGVLPVILPTERGFFTHWEAS